MNKKLFVPLVLASLALLTIPASTLRAQATQPFGGGGGYGASNGVVVIKNINVSTPNTPEYTLVGGEEKRFDIKKWLEIEVEFSSTAPVTPELLFKYYVLMNGTLLTGEVNHVDIAAGQSLFSVMYVSPRACASLLKGQPLNNATVQNIAVQILRPGIGQPVAEKQLKPGPPFYTTLQQVPGLLVNKNHSPFAPLYWDHFEAIKSTGSTGGF